MQSFELWVAQAKCGLWPKYSWLCRQMNYRHRLRCAPVNDRPQCYRFDEGLGMVLSGQYVRMNMHVSPLFTVWKSSWIQVDFWMSK